MQYAEENLSTKQSSSSEKTRVSCEDGNQKRQSGSSASSSERTQASDTASLLGFRLPKECRLRKPKEFELVYAQGKRFDGKFMTAFVLAHEGDLHKLGITASRKSLGKAHDRNRAKRLLREAFRLNNPALYSLKKRYLWVLNAKRSLLEVKVQEPLEEFRNIIESVKTKEDAGEI